MLSRSAISLHTCQLHVGERVSESCLPRLPPNASSWRKWYRSFRKFLLVSEQNYGTRIYFQSHAAVLAERKRQVKRHSPFVIHPLSLFSTYRELVMLIIWTLLFVLKPLNWIIYDDFSEMKCTTIIELFPMVDMLLVFCIGYTNERNKDIVLVHKEIALHYLKTFFFPDIFANYLLVALLPFGFCHFTYFLINVFEEFIRLIRLYSYLHYLDRVTHPFKTREILYEILCTLIVFTYLLHFSTCTVYLAGNVSRNVYHYRSWIDQAGYTNETSIFYKYSEGMLEAASLLYLCGVGLYDSNLIEQIVKGIILLIGGVFLAYVMVKIFALLHLLHTDTDKYDYFLEELDEFMVAKRLPEDLRKKLLSYYEYSFDKRYFSEKAIMCTLSEHLKYEIKLYDCKDIISSVEIFDALPRAIVGRLIACMKDEIILTNEIIYRAGDVANYMYFIVTGTVAVYTVNGKELFHLKDQQSFGELAIIMKRSRSVSIVSVENTHLYVLSAMDLQRCLYAYPNIYGRLVDRARTRFEVLKEKKVRMVENKDLVDILDDEDC